MSTSSNQSRPRIHANTASGNDLPTNRKAKQLSAARRDKKRVADRVCQQKARARTKNRIAELESMVAELTNDSGNDLCKRLMEQLDQSRAECLALKRKLAVIASLARSDGEEGREIQSSEEHNEPDDFPPQSPGDGDMNNVEHDTQGAQTSSSNCHPDQSQPKDSELNFLSMNSPNLDLFEDTFHGQMFSPMGLPSSILPDTTTNSPTEAVTAPVIELSFPESWSTCDCSQTSILPQHPNMWHSMSETLLNWQNMQEEEPTISSIDDDNVVRAIAEGWDFVRSSDMRASWQILRQVDQKVWAKCRPVDRLAVLSIMNMLLQCHLDPSTENLSRLPAWYRPRPSQMVQKHFYAIDFFVWPGLRERFIYHQHKYCGDRFWSLLAQHFRFIWPYDFRDCYVHNKSTGRYQLSELFRNQLNDLAHFTFCKDMFSNFPEFEGDIPKFMTLPMTLSEKYVVGKRREKAGMLLNNCRQQREKQDVDEYMAWAEPLLSIVI